ncbi:MAG TPA: hypothetical protein GXX29_03595 [Firmicutes bacterium]|nr:hypothetical protein [Bacillota bacterium]
MIGRKTAPKLEIYRRNPFYWQLDGRPELLLGGAAIENLYQWPAAELAEHLQELVRCGGNMVGNTMSCRHIGNVWPFARDRGIYNLDAWNEEHWRRFETFLAATAAAGVVVQLAIWDRFDYYQEAWLENPFNPDWNCNYTRKESGLDGVYDQHPSKCTNAFFRSTPLDRNNRLLLSYQERLVDKILSYTLPYDHIIYCIDGETNVTPAWGDYWAQYIRGKAAAAGKSVYITEMWEAWNLADPSHEATLDHPELYDFVDVSANNHLCGERHYHNLVQVRRRLQAAPRPVNNIKIYGIYGGYGNSGSGIHGPMREAIQRFWQCLFAGAAAACFFLPAAGPALNAEAANMIKVAREVLGAFDLFASEPQPDLLLTAPPEGACLLADPGREYALYLPFAGPATIALPEEGWRLELHWFDIGRGLKHPPAYMTVKDYRITIEPPAVPVEAMEVEVGAASPLGTESIEATEAAEDMWVAVLRVRGKR